MTGPTMANHAVRRGGVTAALTASLALALAGCSGSSGGGDGTGSKTGPAPTPSTSAVENNPADRSAVSQTSCQQTPSGWEAGGTVTNPKESAATYTIVISFTTKSSTVLARGTTKVKVDAGQTKKWTARANFAKTKGVQCVLRGVAAS